jgi:cytochrome c556
MLTAIERRRASRYVVGFFVGAMTLSCQRPDEKSDTQLVARAEPGAIAEADKRTAIEVSGETRAAVMTEMRTMLKAVQGIVAGAAKKDTAAIRAAAIKGGMQAASETDPIIQEQLQGDFVQLGMRTHAAFDILAADVVQGNQDVILQRLATIMGNCVGCHEQWRLTVR